MHYFKKWLKKCRLVHLKKGIIRLSTLEEKIKSASEELDTLIFDEIQLSLDSINDFIFSFQNAEILDVSLIKGNLSIDQIVDHLQRIIFEEDGEYKKIRQDLKVKYLKKRFPEHSELIDRMAHLF